VHPLRRPQGLRQHAVDSVADLDVPLVGLDVNVTGPVSNRLGEDQVDHLHDRRLARHLGEVGQVGRVIDLGCAFLGREALKDLFKEVLLDLFPDDVRIAENRHHRPTDQDPQIVHCGKRVDRAHGNDERLAVNGQGKNLILEGELARGH